MAAFSYILAAPHTFSQPHLHSRSTTCILAAPLAFSQHHLHSLVARTTCLLSFTKPALSLARSALACICSHSVHFLFHRAHLHLLAQRALSLSSRALAFARTARTFSFIARTCICSHSAHFLFHRAHLHLLAQRALSLADHTASRHAHIHDTLLVSRPLAFARRPPAFAQRALAFAQRELAFDSHSAPLLAFDSHTSRRRQPLAHIVQLSAFNAHRAGVSLSHTSCSYQPLTHTVQASASRTHRADMILPRAHSAGILRIPLAAPVVPRAPVAVTVTHSPPTPLTPPVAPRAPVGVTVVGCFRLVG